MKFKVNDVVTWTSQAQGHRTTKTGTVVVVIPAHLHPTRMPGLALRLRKDTGCPRDHESYVVRVAGQSKLYWPVASQLLPATVTPDPVVIATSQSIIDDIRRETRMLRRTAMVLLRLRTAETRELELLRAFAQRRMNDQERREHDRQMLMLS